MGTTGCSCNGRCRRSGGDYGGLGEDYAVDVRTDYRLAAGAATVPAPDAGSTTKPGRTDRRAQGDGAGSQGAQTGSVGRREGEDCAAIRPNSGECGVSGLDRDESRRRGV